MYLTEKYPTVPYIREHLQVVQEDEKNPPASMLDKFTIEKLVEKFKKGSKIFFTVKWKGYAETTDESRTELMKDIPDMIKEFESKKK
jgi:hypothetical protein